MVIKNPATMKKFIPTVKGWNIKSKKGEEGADVERVCVGGLTFMIYTVFKKK